MCRHDVANGLVRRRDPDADARKERTGVGWDGRRKKKKKRRHRVGESNRRSDM